MNQVTGQRIQLYYFHIMWLNSNNILTLPILVVICLMDKCGIHKHHPQCHTTLGFFTLHKYDTTCIISS